MSMVREGVGKEAGRRAPAGVDGEEAEGGEAGAGADWMREDYATKGSRKARAFASATDGGSGGSGSESEGGSESESESENESGSASGSESERESESD